LGDGTSLNRTTPVQIPKIFGIQHAAAGAFHTILVNNDGSVTTFGYDGYGQLGTRAVVAPLAVPGLQLQ